MRREGALWGTPRKQALFGSEGQDSVSSGSDVVEARSGWPLDDQYPEVAQSGWPPKDEYLEEARSSRVDLADVVARLQKEVEEFRAESGCGSARRSAIPSQTLGWSGLTSTPVPMYAGKSSWDQHRQVFEAIVCSGEMESPRRGHPQRGLTGAGTPAGVTRSFGEGAIGTLWLSWEIGEL